MLRAALVDVGGTLWPETWPGWDAEAMRRLRDSLDVREDEARSLFEQLHQRDPGASTRLSLTQDTQQLNVDAIQAAGIRPLDARDVLRAMDVPSGSLVRPFPDAATLLADLKALGLHVVVVSNAFVRTAAGCRRDFEQIGVWGSVDTVLSSVDTGVRKPNLAMFNLAVEAAGCAAGDAVMIGDSEQKDIVPAKQLGMKAIRVAVETPVPDRSVADAIVTNLADASALDRLWSEDAVG